MTGCVGILKNGHFAFTAEWRKLFPLDGLVTTLIMTIPVWDSPGGVAWLHCWALSAVK